MVAMPSHRYAVVELIVRRPRLHQTRPDRVRNLLPSADPYIKTLIHRLQDEVRAERNGISRLRGETSATDRLGRFWPQNEAEMPWHDTEPDFDLPDDDRLAFDRLSD